MADNRIRQRQRHRGIVSERRTAEITGGAVLGRPRQKAIDPAKVLTKVEPIADVIKAYEAFDKREPGWIKVELET